MWGDNIKMNIKETACDDLERIHLRSCEDGSEFWGSIKSEKPLDKLSINQLETLT
jgi:hypothetical protein